jgi:GNAT superfamily N-acetyltransferase
MISVLGDQEGQEPLNLECGLFTGCYEGFCCGSDEWDEDLNDFLANDAVSQGERALNKTYVFTTEGKTVAYVALAASQVKAPRRGTYPFAPALLIGKLAVAEAYQSRGVGRQVLAWIRDLARRLPIGCRFLVVHVDIPNSEALRFYEREGFVCPPDMKGTQKQLMIYDLVNATVGLEEGD